MPFRFVKDMPFDGGSVYHVYCNRVLRPDGSTWTNVLDIYFDDELTRTSKPFPNYTVYVAGEHDA